MFICGIYAVNSPCQSGFAPQISLSSVPVSPHAVFFLILPELADSENTLHSTVQIIKKILINMRHRILTDPLDILPCSDIWLIISGFGLGFFSDPFCILQAVDTSRPLFLISVKKTLHECSARNLGQSRYI